MSDTTLQTASRALEVLAFVARRPSGAPASEVCRSFALSRGTGYNLLRTLIKDGYLQRAHGGRYVLGPSAARLARDIDLCTSPPPILSSILTSLNMATRETVYLTGWYHGVITLQQWLPGLEPISVGSLDVGYAALFHARASAKAILAGLTEDEVRRILVTDGDLERVTPHTITRTSDLLIELARVRRQGYATDLEEFVLGVCCVAASYHDATGAPAGAITVTVPQNRFAARLPLYAAQVRDAASRATESLRSGKTVLAAIPNS